MSVLTSPHFHHETKAFEYLESIVWADGIACPKCGVVGGRVYDLSGVRTKPSKKHPKGKVRYGLKKCGECPKQFTVKVGTALEHARLPLAKMLQAVHLMVSSKTGISAHQLCRVLEVQYKSAWFLAHRIREAMRSGDLAQPFGSEGGAVEVDETYIGFKRDVPSRRGTAHKHGVVALVDRESGQSKWFKIDTATADEIHPLVLNNIHREARLMTDEAKMYKKIGRRFAEHGTTTHARGEYVNLADRTIHTNTVEGAFSIFKRGMRAVYQHCQEHHLHRYLAEFEFRYNNRVANGVDDSMRASAASAAWSGAALYNETSAGLEQIGIASNRRAFTGTLAKALPASEALLFEPNAQLTINASADDLELSHSDLEAIANGANRLLVGGEVLQFANAEEVAPAHWRLSGLLRGRAGTENAAAKGHPIGAQITLLNERLNAIEPGKASPDPSARLAAIGRGDSEPAFANLQNAGLSRRPLTPVHPRKFQNENGDETFCWTRRARGQWRWDTLFEPPLIEEQELYLVGYGPTNSPNKTWLVNKPELTLPYSSARALIAEHGPAELWVSQIGTFAQSPALHLSNLT